MIFVTIKKRLESFFRKMILSSMPELYDFLSNKEQFENSIEFLQDNLVGVSQGKNVKTYSPSHIGNSSIGDYTYIAQNSHISNTTIGKFCSIGPNVVCGWGIHPTDGISTHPMFYSTMKQNGMTLSDTNKIEERKPIVIGNDVFIGANVTILDGVTIGDGAVIGAGAVVSKDIPPYAVAVGCPIQVIRYRFPKETCQRLLEEKWWDYDEERLKTIERNEFDIDIFLSILP